MKRDRAASRFNTLVRIAAGAVLAAAVLVGCGESEPTGSPSTDQGVPLADAVDTMEPQKVWQGSSAPRVVPSACTQPS